MRLLKLSDKMFCVKDISVEHITNVILRSLIDRISKDIISYLCSHCSSQSRIWFLLSFKWHPCSLLLFTRLFSFSFLLFSCFTISLLNLGDPPKKTESPSPPILVTEPYSNPSDPYDDPPSFSFIDNQPTRWRTFFEYLWIEEHSFFTLSHIISIFYNLYRANYWVCLSVCCLNAVHRS